MKIKKTSYHFHFFTNMQATQLYEMAEMLLKRWKPSSGSEMDLKLSKYEKLAKKAEIEREKAKKVINVLIEWMESLCEEKRVVEMEKMKKFEEMYGFMPNDVEAKSVYVDKIFYEVMPKNDKERDEFFEGVEMAEMMRMGWKAKW